MAFVTERYRTWCSTCKDWMMHQEEGKFGEEQWVCMECGEVHKLASYKDIPEEKLEEQRARYKQRHKSDFSGILGQFMKTPEQRRVEEWMEMFGPVQSKIEVKECDAGQRQIDEEERKIYQQKQQEMLIKRRENKAEHARYSALGRNDVCLCGSNKKYKKCCIDRINRLSI